MNGFLVTNFVLDFRGAYLSNWARNTYAMLLQLLNQQDRFRTLVKRFGFVTQHTSSRVGLMLLKQVGSDTESGIAYVLHVSVIGQFSNISQL